MSEEKDKQLQEKESGKNNWYLQFGSSSDAMIKINGNVGIHVVKEE